MYQNLEFQVFSNSDISTLRRHTHTLIPNFERRLDNKYFDIYKLTPLVKHFKAKITVKGSEKSVPRKAVIPCILFTCVQDLCTWSTKHSTQRKRPLQHEQYFVQYFLQDLQRLVRYSDLTSFHFVPNHLPVYLGGRIKQCPCSGLCFLFFPRMPLNSSALL